MNKQYLGVQELRILFLAAVGGALEFYDFIIFVFFSEVIGRLFFPPEMPQWLTFFQTLGLVSTGYFFRPAGGIILAQFGDIFGRRRAFAFSILLMASATLCIACLPTYAMIGSWAPAMLLVLRIVQGTAIGGEVPGAWTFVAEHMPDSRVGFACGFLCGGLSVGIMIGSSVATGITTFFSSSEITAYAWRIPFALGGAFGLMGVTLRRWLQETPVFIEMRERRELTVQLPIKAVLQHHRAAVYISLLLTWLLSAEVLVATLMMPSLLQTKYGLDAGSAFKATTVATCFLVVGCICAGWLVDRLGVARMLMAGSAFSALAIVAFYTSAVVSYPKLYLLSAFMGLSVGYIAIMPCIMIGVFPARVRFTGVSFCYNVAYAVSGGLTPVFIAAGTPCEPTAHYYYLLFISALGCGTGLFIQKRLTVGTAQPQERLYPD